MGLNTAAIILNDCVHEIRTTPDLGERLYSAIASGGQLDRYGIHLPGIKILDPGHSSSAQLVAVGGNTIRRIGFGDCGAGDVDLLRAVAADLGYRLARK